MPRGLLAALLPTETFVTGTFLAPSTATIRPGCRSTDSGSAAIKLGNSKALVVVVGWIVAMIAFAIWAPTGMRPA